MFEVEPSAFGVFPVMVWERVLGLAHPDTAAIRLAALNSAFASLVASFTRRRFKAGVLSPPLAPLSHSPTWGVLWR